MNFLPSTGIDPSSYGIAIDFIGNIFITSESTHSISKLTPPFYTPTLFAGNGVGATLDGTGSLAGFNTPYGISVDKWGTIFVTEGEAFGAGGNMIRKITQAGVVTTLAGDGTAATLDGTTTSAQFNGPIAIAIDDSGDVFVQEVGIAGGNILRRIH